MQAFIPILMYHEISSDRVSGFEKYILSPGKFDEQISWLARSGYVTISLDTLLRAHRGPGILPPKPLIITFDDGFRDCIRFAPPILKNYNFTAIFYLVSGLVGLTSSWLIRDRGCELQLADWPEIVELISAGHKIGAHSMSHPRLAKVWPWICRYELSASRKLLEEKLNCTVDHFSYPYGSYNMIVSALAKSVGYASCCSVRPGLSGLDDDVFALHRVPIDGRETIREFVTKVSGQFF